MKLNAFFILFLLCGYLSFSQKYPVSLSVTYIEPYCGGARPSPEMEEKARTPLNYSKKTIVLVNAEGKVTKAKTNSEGKLILKLKAGDYKLYEAWRFNKGTPDGQTKKNYTAECLKSEWTKEFATLKVDPKKSDYTETNGIINNCKWNLPCLLDSVRPSVPE